MKKVILMPDSFKGTLSSIEICKIMKNVIKKYYSECEVLEIPMADGGEGTVESIYTAVGGEKIVVDTTNPFGEKIEAEYIVVGDTAIIEVASVVGLAMVEDRLNPYKATTYGLGAILLNAKERGVKKIYIGLGGSSTNDAGVGMARALGVKFLDKERKEIAPNSNEFTEIKYIDMREVKSLFKDIEIVALCDIDNPMYGKEGAAYVFSPQKGATPEMVEVLDRNLIHISEVIERELKVDVSGVPGGGAAGALGAGIIAFLNGKLESGVKKILEIIDFEKISQGTDMIFTGEGRIDSQSVRGKVISGVVEKAKEKNIPVVAIVGAIGEGIEEMYKIGLNSVFSINTKAMDFSESRKYSSENLERTMDSIIRFRKSFER